MNDNTVKYGRIEYFDPNKNFSTYSEPVKQEDLNKYVNLSVRVPSRYWDENKNIPLSNSILCGTKLKINNNGEYEIPLLTDSYVNVSYNEIKNGKINTGELFGIESIDISFDVQFFPTVTINFVDVKGFGLMSTMEYLGVSKDDEEGFINKTAKSFFTSLFNFPYPIFTLEVKGYYGKNVTFDLSLLDFQTDFDSMTGNFKTKVTLVGHMYGVYGDLPVSFLFAAPYLDYKEDLNIINDSENKGVGNYWRTEHTGIPTYNDLLKNFNRLINGSKDWGKNDAKKLEEIRSTIEKQKKLSNLEIIKNLFDKVLVIFSKDINNKKETFFQPINNLFVENVNGYESVSRFNSNEKNYYFFKVFKDAESVEIKDFFREYLDDYEKFVALGSEYDYYRNNSFKIVDTKTINNSEILYLNNGVEIKEVKILEINKETYNTLIKEIKKLNDELNVDNKIVNELSNDILAKALEFVPNIKNIYELFFRHIDAFTYHFYNTISSINRKGNKILKNAITNNYITDVNEKNLDNIPPFPLIAEKKNDGIVYKYPGEISEFSNEPEIQFVEKLYSSVNFFKSTISESLNAIENSLVKVENNSDIRYPLLYSDFVNSGDYIYNSINNVHSNKTTSEKAVEIANIFQQRIEAYGCYHFPELNENSENYDTLKRQHINKIINYEIGNIKSFLTPDSAKNKEIIRELCNMSTDKISNSNNNFINDNTSYFILDVGGKNELQSKLSNLKNINSNISGITDINSDNIPSLLPILEISDNKLPHYNCYENSGVVKSGNGAYSYKNLLLLFNGLSILEYTTRQMPIMTPDSISIKYNNLALSYSCVFDIKEHINASKSEQNSIFLIRKKDFNTLFRNLSDNLKIVINDDGYNCAMINQQDDETEKINFLTSLASNKTNLKTGGFSFNNIKDDDYLILAKCTKLESHLNDEIIGDIWVKFKDIIAKEYNIHDLTTFSGNNNLLIENQIEDNGKTALYYTLKTMYDKWFSGLNKEYFSIKNENSEFNKIKFLTTAFHDISDSLIVSIENIINQLESVYSNNGSESAIEFMSRIAQDNNCLFLSIPQYAHSNLEDIFKPHTFYNGELISNERGASYVVMHNGDVSHYLAIEDGQYEDDGFSMTDYKGDLTEEVCQKFFGDGATVKAFGITYGMMNQNLFKNISLSTNNPSVTDYSIANTLNIAKNYNSAGGNQIFTPIQNLYPIYCNRSYSCTVEMMGCASIAPLMFFQLNNVPMFKGAYMITNVSHKITARDFTTSFTGTRISKYKIPLNSVSLNLSNLGVVLSNNKKYKLNGKEVNIKLERHTFTNEYTIGDVYVNGYFICNSLEDRVRNLECHQNDGCINQPNSCLGKEKGLTCIPCGIYNVSWEKRANGVEQLYLNNVPCFSDIFIHAGNTYLDTDGCILLGTYRGGNSIGDSKYTVKRIENLIPKDASIKIEITQPENIEILDE